MPFSRSPTTFSPGTVVTSAWTNWINQKAEEFVSVMDFGAKGDGVTDDYPAIMAAINSATYGSGFYVSGPAVYFPHGTYYCSQTINLKKSVRLYGDSSGMQTDAGPLLLFPSNTTGIIINRYNTFGTGLEGTPTTGADGTLIEGLRFKSTGVGSSAHGIWMRARAEIRNCYIWQFGGNGIQVVADSAGGAATQGNANNWKVKDCVTIQNGGHGLYTMGGDANAGVCEGLDTSYNGGWGVYDSSFLGNTYVGVHTAANTLGSYKSDNANARNCFISCYTEGGQNMSVAFPALVIGGLHSLTVGPMTTGTGPFIDVGTGYLRLSNAPVVPQQGLYLGAAEGMTRSTDPNTLDAYSESTYVPTATNLTVVGTPTYSGTFTRIGNTVRFDISVSVSGGTTASTANSTYFSLPITPANRSVCNVVDGNVNSLGQGYIDTNGRVYTPTWSARATQVYISGTYQISTSAA